MRKVWRGLDDMAVADRSYRLNSDLMEAMTTMIDAEARTESRGRTARRLP